MFQQVKTRCTGIASAESLSALRILVWLTLLFIMAQVIFAFIHLKITILTNPIASLIFHSPLLRNQAVITAYMIFFSSHLLLYIGYLAGLWYLSYTIQRLFSLSTPVTAAISLLLWISSLLCIFSANAFYFPHSLFAIPRATLFSSTWLSLLLPSLFFLISACLFVCFNVVSCAVNRTLALSDYVMLGCLVSYLILSQLNKDWLPAKTSLATARYPNIIIIGIDGLRPDQLNIPHDHQRLMPYLSQLLKTSSYFTESYTPITQSLPAWMSLLTGETPIHHGIRGLLMKGGPVNFTSTLPKQLKPLHYETFYAVDGQFFGDIPPIAGFDHLIVPTSGVLAWSTFLLNDFPLSNLLFLTPLAEWLFPYHYGDRFLSTTYHPQAFFNLLRRGLSYRSGQPLLLAMHLDTSHWPFYLADDFPSHQSLLQQYRLSLARTDEQLKTILTLLEKNNLLHHALLILLSDHGISLGIPGDRTISEQSYQGSLSVSRLRELFGTVVYGEDFRTHKQVAGIDSAFFYGQVLSLSEQRVLLAMKAYGIPWPLPSTTLRMRASLLDIVPTIRQYLHLPPLKSVDGLSLLPQPLLNRAAALNHRDLFVETGFQFNDMSHPEITIAKTLLTALPYVEINSSNGLLFMNPPLTALLIKQKQRAILSGDWLLAYLPEQRRARLMPHSQIDPHTHHLMTQYLLDRYVIRLTTVLVNIKTKAWTTQLTSDFAKTAPLPTLIKKFNAYNAAEISPIIAR